MNKEQISIRLDPATLKQIDGMAANEKQTRNSMIEVLVLEAIRNRLFEQIERLGDENLKGEARQEEIKRSRPKKSGT
jgi:hypothetical protein